MDLKKFFKESNAAYVVYTLIGAVVIGLVLLLIVFLWLKGYTRHGKETQVPSICGMYVEEAETTLKAIGLEMEVIDSTYSKKVPLGTIVEQNPPANANVKDGRKIYVIMNARSVRQIPMPELHDVSYRQSEATLNAMGLRVDNIRSEPSEYRDLVLDVRLNGESVEPGTRLPEGTGLLLVVGQGRGNSQAFVPDLKGKMLADARSSLLGAHLIVGAVNYAEGPVAEEDAETTPCFVYDQKPKAGEWVMEGSHVNLYLSTDPNKKPANSVSEDEEFF